MTQHIFREYRSYLGSLILLFLLSMSSCKSSRIATEPQQNNDVLSNALLWEISGQDLKQPSFLFGTMHLIDTSSFFWPKNTISSLERCDEVTFEVDMSIMEDPAKQMSILSKATMKGNKTLADFLSTEEYALVDAHFKKMGLPLFFLDRIKPMFLTVFAAGNKDNVSYELKLLELAKQNNKTISGLETMEYQLSIFDSIPYEDQARSLYEAIQKESGTDDQMQLMIQSYKDQNIVALYEMIESEMDESVGNISLLLDGRNQNWIPVMEKMMQKSAHFFAVGAGHLAGDKGVISLLKKAGYRVTPKSNTKNPNDRSTTNP